MLSTFIFPYSKSVRNQFFTKNFEKKISFALFEAYAFFRFCGTKIRHGVGVVSVFFTFL